MFFSPQAGLGMANILHMSDLLGDHRLSFLLNVYGSLENSDIAASYASLKHRWDLGGGIFHFKNYYNSAFTSVGEVLPDDVFFSERNYGLFLNASYPFSTFRRLSFELQGLVSERTDYSFDPTGFYLVAANEVTHRILQPSVNFVHDSAFYGNYGPVTGSRLSLYRGQRRGPWAGAPWIGARIWWIGVSTGCRSAATPGGAPDGSGQRGHRSPRLRAGRPLHAPGV